MSVSIRRDLLQNVYIKDMFEGGLADNDSMAWSDGFLCGLFPMPVGQASLPPFPKMVTYGFDV